MVLFALFKGQVQSLLKNSPPILGQRIQAQYFFKLGRIFFILMHQSIGIIHGNLMRVRFKEFKGISRFQPTRFQHTQIKTGVTRSLKLASHFLILEELVQLMARLPGLGTLNLRFTDLKDIANMNLGLLHILDGEVFSKSAGRNQPGQFLFPKRKVVLRINTDGLVSSSVVIWVRYLIPFKSGEIQIYFSGDRSFLNS